MVTGDHLSTAVHVAIQTGILRQDELELDKSNKNNRYEKKEKRYRNYVAMTGKQFREAVGRYTIVWDDDRQENRVDFEKYD